MLQRANINEEGLLVFSNLELLLKIFLLNKTNIKLVTYEENINNNRTNRSIGWGICILRQTVLSFITNRNDK